MNRLLSPLPLLALALLCAGSGVLAAPDTPMPADSVNRIERETGGRVLSAQRSLRGGREVNRIKLLTPEGRVRVMWDDPARDRHAPRRGERSLQPAADAARQAAAERESMARDDG
jgi:hypothetical protein